MTSSLTADDSRRRPSKLALLALLALRLIMACTMHTIWLQPTDYSPLTTAHLLSNSMHMHRWWPRNACLLAHKPRNKAIGPSKRKPCIAAGFAGNFLHSSLAVLCRSRSHTQFWQKLPCG